MQVLHAQSLYTRDMEISSPTPLHVQIAIIARSVRVHRKCARMHQIFTLDHTPHFSAIARANHTHDNVRRRRALRCKHSLAVPQCVIVIIAHHRTPAAKRVTCPSNVNISPVPAYTVWRYVVACCFSVREREAHKYQLIKQ